MKTPPARKLPSLYVLDSIVKNVGTPYTIYLGRNLYSTFMDAYTLVDNQTRKNMEAMLKTWKEPVPGSMDTRPVFPPEVTRTIENALIKARTVFVQQQQQQARSQRQTHALPPRPLMQSQDSWRNTPPPQGMSSVAFQPHGLSFLIPPAQPVCFVMLRSTRLSLLTRCVVPFASTSCKLPTSAGVPSA